MRILIIDDSLDHQNLLRRMLNSVGYNDILTADSAAAAFRHLGLDGPGQETVEVDLILMDLVMPGMNGVEATRQIKQVSPRTQVIVLTSYHEDEHIMPAIRAGALSYLLKDVSPSELLMAVRKAAEGETTIHPRVASSMMQALHGSEAKEDRPLCDLSKREIEVLRLIADGLSNSTIAEALFISGLFQNFSGRKKAATIFRSPPSPFIAVDNPKLFLHCVVQFFVSVHHVLMRFLDRIELLLLISREQRSNLGQRAVHDRPHFLHRLLVNGSDLRFGLIKDWLNLRLLVRCQIQLLG